jgi:hypothetical protein
MPAKDLVRRHNSAIRLRIIRRTWNSATTSLTGTVTYIITTSTRRAKATRRNSKRFLPLRIASANSGLIDNSALVGPGQCDNFFELRAGEQFEATRRRVDIFDDMMFNELLQIRAFGKSIRVQESHQKRARV